MSRFNVQQPECREPEALCAIEQIVVPRVGDIGNFEVFRALPSKQRQMVGPFIFWDQMGPGEFIVGQGVDVRPHPHIGLATLTYLFEGSLMHRDSLGKVIDIQPGEVNLMTAGSGIVHSERTAPDARKTPSRLFGIQSWMALPRDKEEMDCTFAHHEREALPEIGEEGKAVRIVAGRAYGETSPVVTQSETLYVDARLDIGAALPVPADVEERALYPLTGTVEIGGVSYEPNQLLILRPGDAITVTAVAPTRLILMGGEPADGPRHIWWNLVSSRKDRIEQAKDDWRRGRFPDIPNETEFIPLPDEA